MVHAQVAGQGQIQGTVTDATGAVVPNATVTLTNVATRAQLTATTSTTGVYVFPNISVATYDLSVTAAGFSTYVQKGIVLEIGSNIAVNLNLAVGATGEKVEVHADSLALQTEDSSFKQTIDQSAVQEMPLNGRQMTGLITLSGGSSPAPDAAGNITGSKDSYQAISVSVAGGMGNTTEWKLDGGDNDDYLSNSNLPFPFPDAVSQLSVESTVLGAESGKHSGGLVNVITRSGTNSYHGSAFEFIRNNYIDVSNFFASSKDQLHQNQFGGTFGGPILKNKLFAFAGYQRTVEKQASATNTMYVPTAANLAGDWSNTDPAPGSPANNCGPSQQLYDPITGAAIPGNKYASAPNYNAQALALYKYLPTTSSAIDTSGCGEVKFSIPSEIFDNQFVTRVDYTISPKHNLYARYMIDGYQSPSFFSPTNVLITYLAPGNYERVQTATIGEAWTIRPDLVNGLHVSGTKRVDWRKSADGINANTIGVDMYQEESTGLQIAVATAGKNHQWSAYCGTCSPGYFNVDNEGISDDLSYFRGPHQLVVGGEFVRVHLNEVVGYDANGLFNFSGAWSGNGPAGGKLIGDANLDFLMGAMSSFTQSKEQQLALRGSVPSLYIQDTFHASKNLTLVGGIRWMPEFMPYDYFSRGSIFNEAAFLADQVSSIYPKAPAGNFFYGDPGVPRAGTKNSPWQFNPNFGVSWSPFGNGNTVIRGGLELAYDLADFYTSNRAHQSPPFATASSPSQSGPLCFSEPWLTGGTGYGCSQTGASDTSPYPQPVVPTPSQATFPAQGQFIVLPDQFHESDMLQWTVSVQHQFNHGWQAQIDYIGSKTSNMPVGTPLSPAIFTPGVWGPNGTGCGGIVTTGAAASAAATTGGGTVGTACSTIKNQQARFALTQANPVQGNQMQGGGGGSIVINDIAWANYNGVVLSLQHRLSSTFSMLTNYTWSKCLNVSDALGGYGNSPLENPYNLSMDYGRCGSDYRNIFNTTLVAKSAFPLHGITKYVANGWELAPLVHILSGAPINITDGTDISLTDMGHDRPNQIAGVSPIKYATIRSGSTEADRSYLNPAAFTYATVPAGAYGNVGRNSVNGPMFFQFYSQISRIFPIGEKLSLDARLEAFNVLNHPNFAIPNSTNPSSNTFGQITSTTGGVGGLAARLFQGSIKVTF